MKCFEILKIEPTKDIKIIKKAYAKEIRLHHPEDDEEGYMKVRSAYEEAMAYAKGNNKHLFSGKITTNNNSYGEIHIENKSFIWPSSVIIVEGEVVGYIRDYVNAKPLCEINPLNISLDKLSKSIPVIQKDIEIISEAGIKTYDMMYNTLYGSSGFKVIDHEDYAFSNKPVSDLIRINNDSLNYEIMYFLVDCYFNEFVNDYKLLKDMYDKSGVDILEFINLFRKYLSEYIGSDVKRLRDAKKCMNKNIRLIKKYERNMFSRK